LVVIFKVIIRQETSQAKLDIHHVKTSAAPAISVSVIFPNISIRIIVSLLSFGNTNNDVNKTMLENQKGTGFIVGKKSFFVFCPKRPVAKHLDAY